VGACSGTRDNPDEGEGQEPVRPSSTTSTIDEGSTTTGRGPGAPASPSGATGQDEGGSTRGSSVPGAQPGQDSDDLEPPRGTYEVPDPGGDDVQPEPGERKAGPRRTSDPCPTGRAGIIRRAGDVRPCIRSAAMGTSASMSGDPST